MVYFNNEKAIAFHAAEKISTKGYYMMNPERLKKIRIPEEEIKRKLESLQQMDKAYLSCNQALLLESRIYEILGMDSAIEKFLAYLNENERFIWFNELIRKSTNEDGKRYGTGEKSIFDTDIISFALIYEFRNRMFSMLFGKKESRHYAPVEITEEKTTEIMVSKNKFSNIKGYDRRISGVYTKEFIDEEFLVDKYYQMYKKDMLRTPSDIIGEYFDKYNGTVTREELGTLYYDYFIPEEMSKFTHRMSRFPNY